MKSKKRLCFLGGSFDPPHLGHLILAQSVREAFGFEQVRFLPAGSPPLKQTSAGVEDRLAMLELALAGNPHFLIDRREVDWFLAGSGVSYTYQSVLRLKAEGPEAELAFVIGMDQLAQLDKWREIHELLKHVRFLTAMRPGFKRDEVLDRLTTSFEPSVIKVLAEGCFAMPLLAISSSEVRKRLLVGASIRYLVPEPVREYIAFHKLYAS